MGKFKSSESAFNVAVAYLERLLRAFDMCEMSSSKGDIQNWLRWLRTTYRILSVKFSKEEDEHFENRFKKVYKLYNDPEKKITEKKKILAKLDKIEIELRKKAQEKGMLLPSKNDPKFAILER